MKTEIKDELIEMDSKLSKFDNEKIFFPPDDYFDKMQNAVLENIGNAGKNQHRIIRLRWMMGIAASLVLILSIVFMMGRTSPKQNALSIEDIYEYLDENVDMLDDEAITNIAKDYNMHFDDPYYSDDLSEYLEENIDDISEEDLEQIF